MTLNDKVAYRRSISSHALGENQFPINLIRVEVDESLREFYMGVIARNEEVNWPTFKLTVNERQDDFFAVGPMEIYIESQTVPRPMSGK